MFPRLGYGVGLRPPHYPYIFEHKPKVDWFEIISENFMDTDGRPKRILEKILADYPVVMHGVSLSIGTLDPLQSDYLTKLKNLIDIVNPPWVSDHLCWTGIAHKNTHDLLPVPYTEEALAHIVERIKRVQGFLGRPLVLENPSTYLEFASSAMPEWEFIARMVEQSGCGLLLDANNVYVSCYNHRLDPKTYIDALPLHQVAQIHLAGHENKGTHIVDTHDNFVIDEVWNLYAYIMQRADRPITTMIEWDDHIPEFPVMMHELDKAKAWANTKLDKITIPTFDGLNRNAGVTAPIPYQDELARMQNAILVGDVQQAAAEEWIVPKTNFKPDDQLSVYINGYRYRLFDIVIEDYPGLTHYLGKKAMAALVEKYIEATPSRDFNVVRYTRAFPEFVRGQADEFAYELAVLETNIVQLADMEETKVLGLSDIAHLTPENITDQKLHGRKALKLLHFAWPVNDYFDAVIEDRVPDKPEKQTTYLAVYRHDDEMWRLGLEEQEYTLLTSLFAGLPVGEAFAASLTSDDQDVDVLAGKLTDWFGRWMHNGLLAAA